MNNEFDEIEQLYEKFNYPSEKKLYILIKKLFPHITKAHIKLFYETQAHEETQKAFKKPSKKSMGKIIALYPGDRAQMDIFDLVRFEKSNYKYKYILCVVDIFTRKAYLIPMINKNLDDTHRAFKKLLKIYHPHDITTDNDSVFLSHDFQELLTSNNIFHDVNIINDHKALSIIDRFKQNLNIIIGKLFMKIKKNNWFDSLTKIETNYNNTPHSGLKGITPNQAETPEFEDFVYSLNKDKIVINEEIIKKNLKKKNVLNIGDKVRIRIDKLFNKSFDSRYSDKTYLVIRVNQNNITLDNNKTYKLENLLKVSQNSPDIEYNPITVAATERRINRRLKQDNINQQNLLNVPRIRNPVVRYA